MAGEAETPFLKLKLPVIEGSAETWGELLNYDLQTIDVGVQTNNTLADSALQRGGTDELKRTATEHLFYADTPGGAIPSNRPHVLVDQKWVKDLINAFMPIGTILLWWQGFDTIPAGWKLCDGGSFVIDGVSRNTPNLQGLFVIGAQVGNAALEPGDTGGFATHEHNLTVDGTNLTLAQIPGHTHGLIQTGTSNTLVGRWSGNNGAYNLTSAAGNGGWGQATIDYAGGTFAGAGNGADHNHTGKANAGSSIPPYRALCYIMKIAEV